MGSLVDWRTRPATMTSRKTPSPGLLRIFSEYGCQIRLLGALSFHRQKDGLLLSASRRVSTLLPERWCQGTVGELMECLRTT